MNRNAARTLAASTITALGTFEAVWTSAKNKFGGISPVCVITSRSLDLTPVARGLYEVTSGISVSIYVRNDAGAEDAAEDILDDLALTVATALHASGQFAIDPSSAGLRDVDRNGILYRAENFPVTVLDEASE